MKIEFDTWRATLSVRARFLVQPLTFKHSDLRPLCPTFYAIE